MSTSTSTDTNGHGHSGDGSGGRSGDGSGDGDNRSAGKSFTRRSNYRPDDLVQMRVPASIRDEFDDWYSTQYPDVQQPPSRDPWVAEAFSLGIAQLREMMPPVLSPKQRFEQARKERAQ